MYVPLNIRTDYSLLKSLIKIPNLIEFCNDKNINICGICDTNLSSSIEFYKLAIKNNIKPIIGLEIMYKENIIYLYALDYEGYKNLLKINTIISDHLIDELELKNYLDNIIVVLPYKSKYLYDLFNNDNLYYGYTSTEEKNELLKISNNIIYINEIRVLDKNDIKYLKILYDISGEVNYEVDELYYKEIIDRDDIKRLDDFAKLINIELPFNKRYIPVFNKDIDSYKYLVNLSLLGLKKRLNGSIPDNYMNRIKMELEVIKKMGFVDYFLIVYDYVLYAKKNDILVGPGRGSAAGSLVSYSIGITDIDPIKYDLLFERFLNIDRITMPDIDIDFDNTRRDDVINYVKHKYGEYNVSAGLTYSTYKSKLVLRDVAKYLNIDESLLNKFLSVINRDLTLKDNLNINNVKKFLNNYEELNKLYEISMHLEGLKKNISTHAAGIVIADRNLDEIIPMIKRDGEYLTGVTMEYLEDLGLLKMDFLALKNLSTIKKIIDKIDNFDLNKIDLNDPAVYELFSSANTDGIFQFETNSFKSALPKIKPKCFSDLTAAIALVRPGPSRELETFIKRKDGLESINYYDERLKSILSETYGVIVYQEQVIRILNTMAKFSNEEADNIRRAMSKKKIDLINKYKDNFIKRSIDNGYSEVVSKSIFDHIVEFAGYGFNKAHSVSYATVSYQMAYLKTYYKYLFTFTMLNDLKGNEYKTKIYLNDIKSDGIKLVKPSFNYSSDEYIIKDKFLYLPFKMIKGLNNEIINKILEERNNGPYESIYDVFKRTNIFINKKVYELLIKADVFKEFKYNMKTLLENLDILINYGVLSNEIDEVAKPVISEYPEMDEYELRQNELNSYGFYISNHPSSLYVNNITKIQNISNFLFKKVRVAVIIEEVHKIKTKKNEDMAFLKGSDETGVMEFTMFPKIYSMSSNINKNDLVIINGEVTKRFDKISIVVNSVTKE